jgi:hypothetical protein
MRIDEKIDDYINEGTYKNAKNAYKLAVGQLTDWADDIFEVVEASGTDADIKNMEKAVENLNKAFMNTQVRINMIDKIAKRFS